MTIDWWTLGLQAVNALILLWLLSRFLFRPVTEIIAKRQAEATKDRDAARVAKADAAAALAQANAKVAEFSAQRADLLAEAKVETERDRTRALNEAQQEIDRRRVEAETEAARRLAVAEKALRAGASELAVDISGRLLDRLPETVRAGAFIAGLADAVERLPERTREEIGAAGPVPVRAAVALTGDEEEALAEALGRALGRTVGVAVTVDSALIAGLELDSSHAVVRNHFRADLDRIRQELLGDD